MNYNLLFQSIAAHLRLKLINKRPEIPNSLLDNNYEQMMDELAKLQHDEAKKIPEIIKEHEISMKESILDQMNQFASDLISFKTNMEVSLNSYQNGYNGCMEHTYLMFLALQHFIDDENAVIKIKHAFMIKNEDINHCFLEFYPNKSSNYIIVDSWANHICPPDKMPANTVVFNILHNRAQDVDFYYSINSDFIQEVETFMETFSSSIFGNITRITGEFFISKYREILKNGLENSPWITNSNFEDKMLMDLYGKGLAHYKDKNYHLAIEFLNKLLPKFHDQPLKLAKVHSLLASCYRDCNKLETAKYHCQEALLLKLPAALRDNVDAKLERIEQTIANAETKTCVMRAI